MSSTHTTKSAEETFALGETLGATLETGDIVLLVGDLGAGKTQFTKGIACALGVREPITSPTFNLVVEHICHRGQKSDGPKDHSEPACDNLLLRHFDLYRLEAPEELDDIDYFGLLEAGDAVSVVEWADKFPDCLPERFVEVRMAWIDEHCREVSLRDVNGSQNRQDAWGSGDLSGPQVPCAPGGPSNSSDAWRPS